MSNNSRIVILPLFEELAISIDDCWSATELSACAVKIGFSNEEIR